MRLALRDAVQTGACWLGNSLLMIYVRTREINRFNRVCTETDSSGSRGGVAGMTIRVGKVVGCELLLFSVCWALFSPHYWARDTVWATSQTSQAVTVLFPHDSCLLQFSLPAADTHHPFGRNILVW